MKKPPAGWRWAAVAAIAAAGTTLVLSALHRSSDPKALVPPPGYTWAQDTLCHVNATQYAGFSGFGPSGHNLIHFTDAELTGVPDSISVRRIYAVSFAANPKYIPFLITGQKDWNANYKGMRLEPVSDVVINPANTDAQWWLVAVFVQTVRVPRAVRTAGLRIDYRVGSDAGTAVFRYEIVSDCR